jgi:hypothetical protein
MKIFRFCRESSQWASHNTDRAILSLLETGKRREYKCYNLSNINTIIIGWNINVAIFRDIAPFAYMNVKDKKK